MSLFLLYDGITQTYDYITMIRQMQDALGGELFAARQARVMYAFIGLTFIAEIAAGGVSLWCFVTTPSVKRLQGAVLALAVVQVLTIVVYVRWLSASLQMFGYIHRILLISLLTWRWKKHLQALDEAGEAYRRESLPFIRELIKGLRKAS